MAAPSFSIVPVPQRESATSAAATKPRRVHAGQSSAKASGRSTRSSQAARAATASAGAEATWTALSTDPLPTDLTGWAVRPSCGALVTFCGTVRDHAEGRIGVTSLTYEAYEPAAEARLGEIAAEARNRWPCIGRVALLHRLGELELSDVAVIAAVTASHRDIAFEAARWCIDAVKESVPIWKYERWQHGAGWGTGAQRLRPVDAAKPVSSTGAEIAAGPPPTGRST